MKYVHSDSRKWSCDECGTKFKQKRDLRVHMLHIHNINYSKEDYTAIGLLNSNNVSQKSHKSITQTMMRKSINPVRSLSANYVK